VSPSADPQGSGSGWLEVGKKQKTQLIQTSTHRSSAITSLFGGTLRSTLHTPGSKDSITIEPYQPLQLDISSNEIHSITDALRGLAQVEVVNMSSGRGGGGDVNAEKQVLLETTPRVLVLHLKRFVYDREIGGVAKRGKLVSFGRELVIPPGQFFPRS
jgi:ubiquitin carboxyl-terminal hydrolase 10